MEKNSVSSSRSVRSLGYDPPSEALEVEFVSGAIYQYYGVPRNMYEQMMSAASKGTFLNTYIKNQYPYSRTG